VRMRDVIAELRAFPADITYLCHDFAPNFGVSCRRDVPPSSAVKIALNPGFSAGAPMVTGADTRHRRLAESSVYPQMPFWPNPPPEKPSVRGSV
jgi:hypothetical protein